MWWSWEKVELSTTFSSKLNVKNHDNQSNRMIFANAALLLFQSIQSNPIKYYFLKDKYLSFS